MAILDSVTNEKVAYSLRKLRTAYAGSAVKVRRDQDSVEADIGFDGSGDFDVAAYNAHLQGSTPDSTIGFVTTWYDQSGSALDMTQTTAELQPQISLADLGPNPRPVIKYQNGWYLDAPDLSALTAAEMFDVIRINVDPPTSSTRSGHYSFGSETNTSHFPFTDGVIYDAFGSSVRKTVGDPTPALTTERIWNVISTSGEWTANLDDAQLFTTATNTVGWDATTARYGLSKGISRRLHGVNPEFIVFDAKLSTADHDSVFSDLQAYYLVATPGGAPKFLPEQLGLQPMTGLH